MCFVYKLVFPSVSLHFWLDDRDGIRCERNVLQQSQKVFL